MRKVFALTLLFAVASPAFASVHAVSRTVKESAKVGKYPVRAAFKAGKALARGAYFVGKQVI